MNRILLINIILLLLVSQLYSKKDKGEILENYRKAKVIFIGKIETVRELDNDYNADKDYFNKKLMIEFDIEQIYKGKRYERMILVEIADVNYASYFILGREYLVYMVKNKDKDAETKYKILRSRRFGDENTQKENLFLLDHIKHSFFRRTKNPVPKFRFIPGG